MNLMTQEIAEILTTKSPHPYFAFKVSEGEGGCINLTVYLDNFAEMSVPQQESCAVWIAGLCKKVRDTGTPCFIQREDYVSRKGQ